MVNYVYAVVHDGSHCLVFTKNHTAQFLAGATAPDTPIAHGPGSRNFPGGAVVVADSARSDDAGYPADGLPGDEAAQEKDRIVCRKAALREFLEETGTNLEVVAQGMKVTPCADTACTPVFFRVASTALNVLFAEITTQLQLANAADWETNGCTVTDNEQAFVERVAVAELPGKYFTENNKDTERFYPALKNRDWARV